jgi:phosphoribosylformylglycinamidine (FGAM) synthase-like amidotransferase family enzyme
MAKALVISGDGINCERETARAFTDEGAQARILHVNEFLAQPKVLLEHSIFCVPGGFSFGDELRSGKILAEKMRVTLSEIFSEFTRKGGLTLGICNGFQVLIQLGAFGDTLAKDAPRSSTLATNDHGKFWDQWVTLEITDQAAKSPWFRNLHGNLQLPIRHKEGRVVPKDEASAKTFRIPLRYEKAVNGSYQQAAALIDPTGQILGLMPHPEAATHAFLNPLGLPGADENAQKVRQIFKNAVAYKGNST